MFDISSHWPAELLVEQIVTLEDVVEEIVGEIFDENDSKVEITSETSLDLTI